MNTSEALQMAREYGVRLSVEGRNLLLEASAEPPAVVLDMLRQHKTELLKVLAADKSDAELIKQAFREGRPVRVWSGVLQEWIWWAPSKEIAEKKKKETNEVIYHPGELIILIGSDKQDLMNIHTLKKNFDGEIIE